MTGNKKKNKHVKKNSTKHTLRDLESLYFWQKYQVGKKKNHSARIEAWSLSINIFFVKKITRYLFALPHTAELDIL